MNTELIITNDGSHTLFVKELDEYYHSHFGAITESKHVFIETGLKAITSKSISILEMGFGTGLNAFLTLVETIGSGIKIHYTGFEKYPLDSKTVKTLNYSSHLPDEYSKYFRQLHESAWMAETAISDDFTLIKIEDDFRNLDEINKYDLIYFDAFAPVKQPELWSAEMFSKIYISMRSGGVLTTYSSKGGIRRIMAKSGLRVEKVAGPPGKRDITRAWKD